ncbi:hypothetical protein HOG17_03760 [Candidatus Peregrinibacteria bacterium]|jgi:hypothetical protein|nr:hypothetical protein [Candidatus Peregrinibacteria bacterium]MBT4148319.1 hypothetical protein [Candidatus Peregrinibacteria bacterium]MBT4366400.1 hypothetical protein [Candidatus Peregrinibacteria bacterium]MBT4455928.1 hypothetical protein [Candidatus Peregrinibacteria bacterium]
MADDVEQNEDGLESQEVQAQEGLSVVNVQNIYREKAATKEVSQASRIKKLPVGEILNGVGIRSFVSLETLGIDASDTDEEILDQINEDFSDDDFYADFVDGFVKGKGLTPTVRDKMMEDSSLKEKFLLHLRAKKSDYKNESDVRKALEGMNKVLSKYTEASHVEVGTMLVNQKNKRTSRVINKRLGNRMTKNQIASYRQWKKGSISDKEYRERSRKFYSEAIKNSDDEELKEMWKEQEEVDLFAAYVEKEKAKEGIVAGFVPIEEKDVEKVTTAVKTSPEGYNFDIKFNNIGVANVETDHCSLVVKAKKDIRTNKFVYFVEDSFSNTGRHGPIKDASELQVIIDGRQVDAFMTNLIKESSKQTEFGELPDDLVSGLAVKLIGSPDSARNYKLREEDRGLLSKLVALLVELDLENLNSMSDKLKKLNTVMEEDEGIENIRRLFVKNDWEGVKEVLS